MSVQKFDIVVCASGGGGNFEAVADQQGEAGYKITKLIVDRVCGAIEKARQHEIPCVLLDKRTLGEGFFDALDREIPADTDLIVLAGFLPILNAALCQKWAGRIINTHPSLLPKYGGKGMYGVKVQEAVLANKDAIAGCTVHYVSEKIDEGTIILQKEITVREHESPWDLGGRVFLEENKLLVEAIKFIMGKQHHQD